MTMRTQLVLAIAFGQVLALALAAIPVHNGREKLILSQAREAALRRARVVAELARPAVGCNSRAALHRAVEALKTSPDFLQGRVLTDGSVSFRTGVRASDHPAIIGAEHETVTQHNGCIAVSIPLEAATGQTERLELEFSADLLHDQISAVTDQVIQLVLVGVLAGLGLALVLGLRIAQAVERLGRAARAIGGGDLDAPIPHGGPAELAALGGTLHEMAASLALSREELTRANAHLEVEVERRTAELVKTQQELVDSARLAAVGQMSTQVAHELRSPLTTIALEADQLADTAMCPACHLQLEPATSAIRRSVEALDLAVSDYLGFAHLESAAASDVDVNRVIMAVSQDMAEWLSTRRVRLELDLAREAPAARCDPARLRVSVRCLIRNAGETMRAGGTLSIQTRRRDGSAEIRFVDSGPCIPEGVRQDLFGLLRPHLPNATGLCLSLAQETARACGARIELERSDDTGSTFVLVMAG